MNYNKKYVKFLPFLITCIIMIYSFLYFINVENLITTYHILGLVLLGINIVLYSKEFDLGINITGIILILGTFNIILFFPELEYSSISFYVKVFDDKNQIKSPRFNKEILLIFIVFLLLNWKLFLGFLKIILLKIRNFFNKT